MRVEVVILLPAFLAIAVGCANRSSVSPAPAKEYREVQIEQLARLRPGSPTPRYPVGRVPPGAEGRVVVSFVVTEEGTVDLNTVQIVETSGHAFTAAVRDILPRLRFEPSELAAQECAFENGRPVLNADGPECRGTPKRTGIRVRSTVEIPYEFREP